MAFGAPSLIVKTCTYPAYFLKYLCKHIVSCAALEKLLKISCVAKSVEIGQKPTRGRPAQATMALQHQEQVIAPVMSPVIVQTEAPVKIPAKRGRKPKSRPIEEAFDSTIASDPPPSLVAAAPRLLLLTKASKRKVTETVAEEPIPLPAKRNRKPKAQ